MRAQKQKKNKGALSTLDPEILAQFVGEDQTVFPEEIDQSERTRDVQKTKTKKKQQETEEEAQKTRKQETEEKVVQKKKKQQPEVEEVQKKKKKKQPEQEEANKKQQPEVQKKKKKQSKSLEDDQEANKKKSLKGQKEKKKVQEDVQEEVKKSKDEQQKKKKVAELQQKTTVAELQQQKKKKITTLQEEEQEEQDEQQDEQEKAKEKHQHLRMLPEEFAKFFQLDRSDVETVAHVSASQPTIPRTVMARIIRETLKSIASENNKTNAELGLDATAEHYRITSEALDVLRLVTENEIANMFWCANMMATTISKKCKVSQPEIVISAMLNKLYHPQVGFTMQSNMTNKLKTLIPEESLINMDRAAQVHDLCENTVVWHNLSHTKIPNVPELREKKLVKLPVSKRRLDDDEDIDPTFEPLPKKQKQEEEQNIPDTITQ